MIRNFLVSFCLLLWAISAHASSGINIFAYSREAPDVAVYDNYGRAVKLTDYEGDFVIAVFWSKTCIPCLREMKDLNSFVKKTRDNGIKVLLISSAKEWENRPSEQEEILQKYGGEDIEHYVDKKSALANAFGIFTSPHSVLVNTQGMEIGRIRGAVDWDDNDVIDYIYKLRAAN